MGKVKQTAKKIAIPVATAVAIITAILTHGVPYFNRIMAGIELRTQAKITAVTYKYKTDSLQLSQKMKSDSTFAMEKIQADSISNEKRHKRQRKFDIRDSIANAHYQVWNNNLMDEIQCNIKRMDSLVHNRKCK